MSRTSTTFLALCIVACFAATSSAQIGARSLISQAKAHQFGLHRSWFTQVELDTRRGRIRDMRYFISAKDSVSIYEVHYNGRRQVFSELDVDRYGNVVGKEKAEQQANDLVETLELEGIKAEVKPQQIPEITLYVTTDQGLLHAIDAETGRTRWTTIVGNPDYPTLAPGASEDYLAVVNGTSLYLVKRHTGDIAWRRTAMGVPSAGAALTDRHVLVPTYTGNVERYEIEEIRTLPSIYKSNGRVLIQPVVTALSVIWPTDRGFLYVAQASGGVNYRLEARQPIVAQPSHVTNRLFTASIDGDIYCVQEISGDEYWRFPTGEPISQTPVPIGKSLYTVSDRRSLFCLDQETGDEKWWAPQIKQLISGSNDRLYCLDVTGRVVVLDSKSGSRIATMDPGDIDVFFTNLQTDRILLATSTGLIQCFHETQNEWPLLHVSLEKPKEEKAARQIEQEEMEPGGQQPAAPQGGMDPDNDPFGGPDPFGGGAANDTSGGGDAAADPFGGSGNADPFGGGGGGNADPFGGAGNNDPFGAGGNDPFAN